MNATAAPETANGEMKRPISITIIGWMFIAAGLVGLAYHATEVDAPAALAGEVGLILFIRLLAIVAGVFLLRGCNWARWLLVIWIGYHVGLSVGHTPSELVMHSLLFVGVFFFLFRGKAAAYFRRPIRTRQNPNSNRQGT